MNILFVTIAPMSWIFQGSVYSDVVKEMATRPGINIWVVAPAERREKLSTECWSEDGVIYLRVKTLNNTKTSFFEKALALLTTPKLLLSKIRKHLSDVQFDLILYSTPPVNFCNVVLPLKIKCNAHTYLMQKDMWPQTGVDLGAFKEGSFAYKYLLAKEKKMFEISDYIGCMSQANIDYVIKRYPKHKDKLEILPNTIIPTKIKDKSLEEKTMIRDKYCLPNNKILFVYGGSLGKPQGVSFIQEVIEASVKFSDCFFFIIGAGTEFERLSEWAKKQENVKLIPYLPRSEYIDMLNATDVGLVFLNKDFTTPNIPSRILDYMQVGIPVLAATDRVTDIGEIIESGDFGLHCYSDNVDDFLYNINSLRNETVRNAFGQNARKYLDENWTSIHACDIILKHFSKELGEENENI